MKIKQLIINNIASIEHAEIDFDATPLSDEHLFLITGPTGSGKSTIIDCICLALYGTTPRLSSASKDKYEASKGQKEINASQPKQLLRRGAVEGNVYLTFDDNKGTPYIATWEVARARKKADGNILDPKRCLRTADGVNPPVHKEKVTDIDEHIYEIIGLNVNQFFRTVVLAQGKFAEFLNSTEKEKANLLEKMTGTEVYAQVGKKIYEVCREKENGCKLLRELLQQIVLLNDEQKDQIQQEISLHTQEQSQALKQRDGARKMADWIDKKRKNEQELATKQELLDEKRASAQAPAHLARQQLVADWDATIESRRELRECQRAEREIEALQAQQTAMQVEFDGLCAALRAAISNLAKQQDRLQATEAYLEQEAPNSEMYSSIKSIKMLLRQLLTERGNIDQFTKALEKETERRPRVETQVQDTLRSQQEQEAKVNQMQAQYDAIGVADINRQKDALNNAKQALSLLKGNHAAIAQATERLDGFKTELETAQQALQQTQATLNDKRTIKEQAQAAVERETDWNNLLQQAHKSLHEGEPCPVCGNTIHKLLKPKGESVFAELRQQLKQADDELGATLASIESYNRDIQRTQQRMTKAQKEVDSMTKARDNQWLECRQQLSLCGQPHDEMIDSTRADALIASLDQEATSLNSRLEQATRLNNVITAERKHLAELTQAHSKATIDLNNVDASIKSQRDAIAASTQRLENCTAELNGLFAMADWQQRLSQDEDFIRQLESRATDYQNKQKLVQTLKHDIGVATAVIPAMEADKAGIRGLTDNGKTASSVPSDLKEQWSAFKSKYTQWNSSLDNERSNASRSRQALDQHLNGNPTLTLERLIALDRYQQDEIDKTRREIQELKDTISRMEGETATLAQLHNEIIAGKPDFAVENREELEVIFTSSHNRYEELTTQIAVLNERLRQDQANAERMGEKKAELDKAEAIYQQWAKLNEHLGSADGSKFQRIAQSYILGELLNSANGFLRQFNNHYELEAKPGTLVILVRDLQQGDLTSISTLSGGESFMVSLALALALSSTTGKFYSMDTLFIDEGFGSLSEQYLNNVMETLNRLYDMGGRRVGIISHVEALKECVTTHITVERDTDNNTASRVSVIVR